MNPDKIRNILNVLFMVLALAAIIVYFAVADFKVFIYLCGGAIFVKLMEFFIRFTNR
ncbi:hypothetical protein [Bacteroides sp.]|uniref:hypothetical protein n=1 Tax=Bacteroides sp. TaxID=29523 RepID=UPI001B43133D|nr:hypothetical protein [Bacteroides sp.]MBP6064613.1 hypothetical protein [Bacteroides sp.]MBP6066954.1 hypothetical protein [Bacteroides sp.]MBP6935838.1 hypothetical protein [Bacteroides sp.]MBP8622246.1 hypothetical protein [Bacteroides sp.]MBP9506813.1 hypothetical protein [Bacteroides sp.]